MLVASDAQGVVEGKLQGSESCSLGAAGDGEVTSAVPARWCPGRGGWHRAGPDPSHHRKSFTANR